MKCITVSHPKLGVFSLQFSPHVAHNKLLELLGNPPHTDAGFVTLPDGVKPKYVGHSTSLSMGPSSMGQKLLEIGYETTASQYPYNPLFDTTANG